MIKARFYSILLLFLGSGWANSVCATTQPVVDLGYAKYQGSFNATDNITTFLGIRFAAAPLGDLRFRAPQPPANIAGVQSATSPADECWQVPQGTSLTTPFRHSMTKRATPVSNEDCLFLNVYVSGTIDSAKALPVVVWIHGGGYLQSSQFGADGADLIREAEGGIIAVHIQYRLGIFGFLAGKEVKKDGSLNAGLLDQNFALQWVQKHISAFGGDPDKVTIFGESAGAGSVLQHIVAHGGNTQPPLFRGAVAVSPFLPSQYAYDDPISEQMFNETVSRSNCTSADNVVQCLRQTDVAVLQTANTAINAEAFFGTFATVPVVDGEFIVERPTETLKKGKHNGEALLSTTSELEGFNFVSNLTTSNLTHYIFELFPRITTPQIQAAVRLYENVSTLQTPLDRAIAVQGETIFICPSYYLLKAFPVGAAHKGELAVPPATHGQDVVYYFPSLGTPNYNNTRFLQAWDQSILSVVKFLNPNHKINGSDITPAWAPWTPNNPVEMLFNRTAGDEPVVKPDQTDEALLARCAFWENLGAVTAQ